MAGVQRLLIGHITSQLFVGIPRLCDETGMKAISEKKHTQQEQQQNTNRSQ